MMPISANSPCEERPDEHSRFWIEDIERVVHDNPARSLQNDPGKSHALFLVVGQLPVPSVLLIEVGLEVLESDGGERLDDGGSVIVLGWVRVGDGRAEGAGRDIGADRHEHDGVTRRGE